MRIKRKNGLKIAAITITLLLCLALAVGITGAWYQAKRQATGTLSMDQGIIIDYKGFDKTPDEGIWTRETTTTFLLFNETNAQPGEQIAVNAAGIRANEKSVNFYARVKLSYKFYNNGTEVTTLPNASDLITTSANFFGTNWVDGGGADGYYYYATGSTLNKFEKGAAATTPFVNLFATDAKFIIEGAGFTGADNNGESGGFKIDETTSINKIEVYLTLETLQGDATAEQAKALGWKIAAPVRFAEATGKMETSVNKTATTEDLNVSVAGATEVPINEVVFPYDTDTTLKFDSNNVEYVTLTYEDGSSDTFEEIAEKTISVRADSNKGKVTGYVVGLFSSSEYTGFTFSTKNWYESEDLVYYPVKDGVAVTGYLGGEKEIIIPTSVRLKTRDFKLVFNYSSRSEFLDKFVTIMASIQYPCYLNGDKNKTFDSLHDILSYGDFGESAMTNEEFMRKYPNIYFEFECLCETSGLLATNYNVKEIGSGSFGDNLQLTKVTIEDGINVIGECAFQSEVGSNLTTIIIPNSVTSIGGGAFDGCSSLISITIPDSVTSIGDSAFFNCSGLTSVTIGNGITSIGYSAFDGCSGLTSVTLGNSVTNIGERAFHYCNRLTSITIPSSVTSIAGNAFSDCSVLITTIGEGWVKASDNTAVDASTLLKDINYDIKRTA